MTYMLLIKMLECRACARYRPCPHYATANYWRPCDTPDRMLWAVRHLRQDSERRRAEREWKRERVRRLLAEHAPLGSTSRNAVTAACHLRDLGHTKLAAMLDRMYLRDLRERVASATPEQLRDLDVSIAAHAQGEGWDPGTRDFGAERMWREHAGRRWGI